MTRDPIRRRFGHGAARLAIGLPPAAERLGELARTPIRLERRLTLVPFTTAVLVVWLLATSDSPPPLTPAVPNEIRIAQGDWTASARPLPEMPAPVRRTERTQERPLPESTPRERLRPIAKAEPPTPLAAGPRPIAADLRPAPTPAARPTRVERERAAPFDVAALATRGAAVSRDPILTGSRPIAASVAAERPGGKSRAADQARSESEAELVDIAGRSTASRRAYLAELERTIRPEGTAAGAASDLRRPTVSAARAPAPLFATSSGRGDLGGWQEVPLDELPDCDPPGRQDLLKKRILLAAASSQECSHGDGSYRFVETRNLGAFLLGSRANPEREAKQPRDRDACDVLERALACLRDPASQESKSR